MALYCEQLPGCICRKCLYWWSSRCEAKCETQNCHGGWFYQAHECERYIECDEAKTQVKDCLEAVTVIYQDGYISCSLADTVGCEECYRQFEERQSKKEEEESTLLKTYYTKCGREFKKSSTASVTGYEIDENDKECAECPFQVEITKGYPEKVHERWECRAGSKKPNQTNDWYGSLEDKNTISIRSLHNDFLEAVMEYCKSTDDISASYNQDLEDCRRVISVSCSQNKKGIAAKKVLIEKFFSGPWGEKQEKNQLLGRSLEIIETEINFYKTQAASSIIEIGKRLIEAKQQLQHGAWSDWLHDKVEFTERTAQRFMKVAEETSKTTALSDLPITKVYALLDIPADDREQFIQKKHDVNGTKKTIDEMTTRELQKVIKERDAEKKAKEEAEQKAKIFERRWSARESAIQAHQLALNEEKDKVRNLEIELRKTKETPVVANEELQKKEQEIVNITQELEAARQRENDLQSKIKELQNRPVDVAVQEVVPDAVQKELEQYRSERSEEERLKTIQADFHTVDDLINMFFKLSDKQIANYFIELGKIEDDEVKEVYIKTVKAVVRKVNEMEYEIGNGQVDYDYEEDEEVQNTCQMCGKADPKMPADDDHIYCSILECNVERDNPEIVCGHFRHFAEEVDEGD